MVWALFADPPPPPLPPLPRLPDVLFTGKPYPASAVAPDWAMDAVLLHALNHVAKAGDRIKRNNERLKGAEAAAQGGGGKRGGGGGGGNVAVEDVPRDQVGVACGWVGG